MKERIETYLPVEKAKEKARKLINDIIIIYQTTSVSVGILKEVGIEKLWSMRIPYCKLYLQNFNKFDLEGKLLYSTDEEIIYINKPEYIFSLEELKKSNEKLYKKIKEIYGL